MDRQAAAFRDASPMDWSGWESELEPVPDSTPVRSVEEWEARRWDAGRTRPKSLPEARGALGARVRDPGAPDDDPGAYYDPDVRETVVPRAAGSLWVPWLADAARSQGLPVTIVPGQASRGHGGMRVVEGVVGHHTATPESAGGDYPSLRVVRDGRAGLVGPLCNYGLGRSGMVYVVAAGCAYHAGASAHAGFTDLNDEFLGIEAEDSGDGTWTPAMLAAYPRLVAGILTYARRGADRYVSHRDCARPAGRKPDPKGLSDSWMRERVAPLLGGYQPPPTPVPTPVPTTRGENMINNHRVSGDGWLRLIIPVGKASSVTARAWISLVGDGPAEASAHVWFQAENAGLSDGWLVAAFSDGLSRRPVLELPDGTVQINIKYSCPNGGSICIETQSR